MTTPAPGNKIGPYQITREIGRGGMGVVYLARDTKLDRDVAIKCLPDELADDADRLARFEREAKFLASLKSSKRFDVIDFSDPRMAIYLIKHVPSQQRGIFEFRKCVQTIIFKFLLSIGENFVQFARLYQKL